MNPQPLGNGLTPQQEAEIDQITVEIHRLIGRIEALGRHRSCSLAVTKLDEARHWIRDRLDSAPQEPRP